MLNIPKTTLALSVISAIALFSTSASADGLVLGNITNSSGQIDADTLSVKSGEKNIQR